MRSGTLVSRGLAVIAGLAVFPMLALVLKRGVDVPFWDEWDWIPLIYAAHMNTLTIADVWAPHNEHRIFFPNLLMLALDRLGGWDIVREQVVSVAMIALTQLIVWLIVRRTVRATRRGIIFFAGTLLLYGLTQYENLYWGFQMAWFLCDLCLVGAIWALTWRRDIYGFAVAVVFATVGSLSSSQGLMVWVSGAIVIALASRRALRLEAIWLSCAVVVAVAARSGVSSGDPAGHGSLAHAPHFAGYLFAYLGTPVATSFGVAAAVAAGVVLIGWIGFVAVLAVRGPLARRVKLAPWLGIAAFSVLCAVVTAFGRGGNDISQATSSRYTTISSLGWIAVIAATAIIVPHLRLRRALLYAPALALISLSVVQSRAGNWYWHLHAQQVRDARALLAQGDRRALGTLYPDARRITYLLRELDQIHDGLFIRR